LAAFAAPLRAGRPLRCAAVDEASYSELKFTAVSRIAPPPPARAMHAAALTSPVGCPDPRPRRARGRGWREAPAPGTSAAALKIKGTSHLRQRRRVLQVAAAAAAAARDDDAERGTHPEVPELRRRSSPGAVAAVAAATSASLLLGAAAPMLILLAPPSAAAAAEVQLLPSSSAAAAADAARDRRMAERVVDAFMAWPDARRGILTVLFAHSAPVQSRLVLLPGMAWHGFPLSAQLPVVAVIATAAGLSS